MKIRTNGSSDRAGAAKARILLLSYRLINSGIELFRFLLWPRKRPISARTVCVYRIGNIGDTICAFPAISTIRQHYPAAKLVLLTSAGFRGLQGARDVLAGVTWIDEIVEYLPEDLRTWASAVQFLRRVRKYHFDVYIELPNDLDRLRTVLRNMVFARLAGARWAGGWMLRTLRVAKQSQSEWIAFPNEVERQLENVRRYGIPVGTAQFDLPVSPHAIRYADRLLEGFPSGSGFIALAPGAKRPSNRWPIDRFGAVGREMAARGYYVLILGSEGERADAENIRREIGRSCTSFAGELDICGSMAVIRRCALLICNDSGLQHAASAVGTPSVSVFSARDMWGKWRPNHPRAVMLRKWVPCHTCFASECPNNNLCLTEISADEVVTAAARILATPAASPKLQVLATTDSVQ